MKLVYQTAIYGSRVVVQDYYYGGFTLFFRGRQPQHPMLILVEMVGLTRPDLSLIAAWLAQNGYRQSDSRRDVLELPETVWRAAVLDDVLEVQNYQTVAWYLANHFDLAAFDDFARRRLPQAVELLQKGLMAPAGESRAETLQQIKPLLERIFLVLSGIPNRVQADYQQTIKELETAYVRLLRQQTFSATQWIEAAGRMKSNEAALDLLMDVIDYLSRPGTDQKTIQQTIAAIGRHQNLRQLTQQPTAPLWYRLSHALQLESNVTDRTISIAAAKEQRAVLGWELFDGQRIGRVISGRSVLVMTDESGQKLYIAGQRKLKQQVQQAGGRLPYRGNTLIMDDAASNNLNQTFLEAEILDTLANVAPQQALDRITHLQLPAGHPIYQAAAAASHDPRQSRILADLLIELVVGVDADIVRSHLRQKSR